MHGGAGGVGGGGDGDGGEGQLSEGQLKPMRAVASKAEVPFHAQRMSSLLALDREFALCRESKEGYKPYRAGRGVRVGRREAVGDRGASSVQEGLDCRYGAGHGHGAHGCEG